MSITYIAIVDDNRNLRNTLKEKLSQYNNYKVLFVAENGKDFLEAMREARLNIEPDVVLMDIDMPIMNGIDAVTEGKLRYSKTKYLMLTIFDDDEKIFNVIKAGADGYLLKDEPVEKIKEAIDNILRNEGAPMSPSIARKMLNMLSNTEQHFSKSDKTETR